MTHNTGFMASYMSLCLFSNDLEGGIGERMKWPNKVSKSNLSPTLALNSAQKTQVVVLSI